MKRSQHGLGHIICLAGLPCHWDGLLPTYTCVRRAPHLPECRDPGLCSLHPPDSKPPYNFWKVPYGLCYGLFVFQNTNKPGEEKCMACSTSGNALVHFNAKTCRPPLTVPIIDSLVANQVAILKRAYAFSREGLVWVLPNRLPATLTKLLQMLPF